MKMRCIILALCVGTATSLPAQVIRDPIPEEVSVTGKKVCKMETRTGSITPRRVCRTKDETREAERARGEALQRLQDLRDIHDIQEMKKRQGGG